MTFPYQFDSLLEELTVFRKTLRFTSLLQKDMIKDKQPNEQIQSNVWEGPERRSFSPHRVGVCHPPGIWMCLPTRSLNLTL